MPAGWTVRHAHEVRVKALIMTQPWASRVAIGKNTIALVAVILIGACGGDSTGPVGCDASTVVSVSAGLEPAFSWPSGCRVASASVEQVTPSFAVMWEVISSTNENVLGSPLQYGRLPTTGGLRLGTGPVPLVAGRVYRVILQPAGRLGANSVNIEATFTP